MEGIEVMKDTEATEDMKAMESEPMELEAMEDLGAMEDIKVSEVTMATELCKFFVNYSLLWDIQLVFVTNVGFFSNTHIFAFLKKRICPSFP